MMMNRNRAIAWLYGELPGLVRDGLLSETTADRLREYYGPANPVSRRRLALLLFAILGAASIGLGVILLLAHNWPELSRPVRTVLSFAPLAAGQALVAWTLLKRNGSAAWREGGATFLTLAIGACIALISQTYNLRSDMDMFLLAWILLAAPLIYLLRSTMTALLYIAGITAWIGAAQFGGGHAWLFWPLASVLAPHIRNAYRENPEGARFHLLSWGLCAALPVAVGFALERVLPGVWVVVYAALFATLRLTGSDLFRNDRFNAFRMIGFAGIAVLALAFTYDDVWREIGWRHVLRYDTVDHAVDYALVFALLAAAAALAVRAVRRLDGFALVCAAFPVLAVAGFAMTSLDNDPVEMLIMFNAYGLVFGVAALASGFRRNDLIGVNAGMAALAAFIVARFFDADIGFTLRGVLFIVLGLGFLFANVVLARGGARKEGAS